MFKGLLRFPYLSVLLLLLTYTLFGWQWFERGQAWGRYWGRYWDMALFLTVFWSGITIVNLFVIGVMTAPLASVRVWFLKLFQSDTRAFLLAIGFTFMGVLLVVHLSLTLEWMILLAALMLARLELQDYQCSEWVTFWILAIVTMMGLGMGGLSHYYSSEVSDIISLDCFFFAFRSKPKIAIT